MARHHKKQLYPLLTSHQLIRPTEYRPSFRHGRSALRFESRVRELVDSAIAEGRSVDPLDLCILPGPDFPW